MKETLSAFSAAVYAEARQMSRSRLFIFLSVIQAVTFLLLVSLFGLTGSMAPTAIINNDSGPYSKLFLKNLENAHHSFSLRFMDTKTAVSQLNQGRLVAMITIPADFSQTISVGQTAPIDVSIDNIDTDLTDDIQRAIPSAITAFGRSVHLPNIRVHAVESDLLARDTGFIPYLVVSALVLDAFVLAGILSAVAVAREYEQKTIKALFISPVSPLVPLLGRVFVAAIVSLLGMGISTAVVILGFHVEPLYPLEALGAIILCVFIFSCIGAVLGILLRRTLPVASLIFGLSLPFYIDSGSLEPERFDGNLIWGLAHISPMYSAIGILEHAFHGFRVTPESILVDFLVLIGWAVFMLIIALMSIQRRLTV